MSRAPVSPHFHLATASVAQAFRAGDDGKRTLAHVLLSFRGEDGGRLGHFKLTPEQALDLCADIEKQLTSTQRPEGS
jgi:hypothetical protein